MIETLSRPSVKKSDPFVAGFERFEREPAAAGPSWMLPLRQAGLARFAELGFPTLQHEDWRFTNVAPIAKLPFKPVFESARDGLDAAGLARFTFARLNAHRLVFVNGHFSAELSSVQPLAAGVRVESLAAALAADAGAIRPHLAARDGEAGEAGRAHGQQPGRLLGGGGELGKFFHERFGTVICFLRHV